MTGKHDTYYITKNLSRQVGGKIIKKKQLIRQKNRINKTI